MARCRLWQMAVSSGAKLALWVESSARAERHKTEVTLQLSTQASMYMMIFDGFVKQAISFTDTPGTGRPMGWGSLGLQSTGSPAAVAHRSCSPNCPVLDRPRSCYCPDRLDSTEGHGMRGSVDSSDSLRGLGANHV